MPASSAAADNWWGYAEADPTIVGVLVLAIAVLAVVHVIGRVRRNMPRDRDRRNTGRPAAPLGRKSASHSLPGRSDGESRG
ncbi:MAG: hypothetical protein MJE77_07985 [Proteobacteria bacterium]|nr:hypothetical protein [Pseudomonadota bacterium]